MMASNKFSTSSIAIRFNVSKDESDDDDILTGSPKDALKFEVHKTVETENEKQDVSPVKEINAESINEKESIENNTSSVKEDKSLLSGLKERISDKIRDPLTAFINEKLEDFTNGDNKIDSCSIADEDIANNDDISGKKINYDEEEETNKSNQILHELVDDFFEIEKTDDLFGNRTALSSSHVSKSFSADQITSHMHNEDCNVRQRVLKSTDLSAKTSALCLSSLLTKEEVFDANENTNDLSDIANSNTGAGVESDYMDKNLVSKKQLSTVPWLKIGALVGICIAYIFVPLSSFTYGFLFGLLICSAIFKVYLWLYIPPVPIQPLVVPDMEHLKPFIVPNRKNSSKDGKFKVSINNFITHFYYRF